MPDLLPKDIIGKSLDTIAKFPILMRPPRDCRAECCLQLVLPSQLRILFGVKRICQWRIKIQYRLSAKALVGTIQTIDDNTESWQGKYGSGVTNYPVKRLRNGA